MSLAIQTMFNRIASRYDFLNHFLSAGRDIRWRKRAVKMVPRRGSGHRVLDLCGGTGDFLRAWYERHPRVNDSVLADFSFPMLNAAAKKRLSRVNRDRSSGSNRFTLLQMDALHSSLRDDSFDVVLCGFGMRNLDHLEKGIENIHGLLTNGGHFVTLEFFRPTQIIARIFYRLFAPLLIPVFGALFSGQKGAYHYLVSSIQQFHSVSEYQQMLRRAGFQDVTVVACDFGISHIVIGKKGEPGRG